MEDNKELVDMLYHFNVTLSYIKVVCSTATGETATGFLTLKKINSAIARLHNITLESSLPAESIDLSDIPTIEEMHAATGGPVPVLPTPLESPETSTAQAVRRTTQKSTSDLHIRSSTFITTTRRTNTPPHHKKITVSLSPRTSPTPSSSSRNRGTRTVCAVRTVSSSRSPDRHRRQRMSPSRLQRPSPPREPQPPDLVCHFCHGNHYSAGCTEVKSLTDRAIRAVSFGKCLYCLKAHSPGYCKRNIACRVCDSTEHHPALCPLSYFLIRDIGPDVSKFFGAMYVLYENYHRCR
uniref:Nucleic-acid-binding protein from transposon X-element n=1 Tax=Haemonchus contortus TaxID=6289 RepID=A0A7I4Z0L3_HAECO